MQLNTILIKPGEPHVKSYNTIFSPFTILIRYHDEVYAYSTLLVSCYQTGLKLELPNANNNTKVRSFKSNEHICKKEDGTRLSSILVSTDKFKAFMA